MLFCVPGNVFPAFIVFVLQLAVVFVGAIAVVS